MITAQQIQDLVDNYCAGTAIFLVETVIRPTNKITVYIDGDHRVTVEECRRLNRFLEEELDRDLQDFDLTVSSAGTDRPLRLLRQYTKNIGNDLKVTLMSGTILTGTLIAIGDDTIQLNINNKRAGKTEKEELTVKFNDIKSAVEVIKFKK